MEQLISIHAPTRGATPPCRIGGKRWLNFNPRSHERSDQRHRSGHRSITISIHAPTRGATGESFRFRRQRNISIHAPTRGATKCGNLMQVSRKFQSTLPREERQPQSRAANQSPCNFNPRSHERSDGRRGRSGQE